MPQTASVLSPRQAPSAGAVVSQAVTRAARLLGLNNAALAAVLGLSEPTISRLASGAYTLDPAAKSYELALLLIRLFRSLDAMVGGEDELVRTWMRSPNLALSGIPADKVRTVTGLVETVAYVDSARARV